jgi:hypothetical protein
MLDWRGNLSAHVACMCREKQVPDREKLWSSALQCTAENAMLDFVDFAVFWSVSLKTELL